MLGRVGQASLVIRARCPPLGIYTQPQSSFCPDSESRTFTLDLNSTFPFASQTLHFYLQPSYHSLIALISPSLSRHIRLPERCTQCLYVLFVEGPEIPTGLPLTGSASQCGGSVEVGCPLQSLAPGFAPCQVLMVSLLDQDPFLRGQTLSIVIGDMCYTLEQRISPITQRCTKVDLGWCPWRGAKMLQVVPTAQHLKVIVSVFGTS